jgi:hypothetical protein
MLNGIVPPPMLLASRIAWRNEPVPLSFVFVTVKTKGVLGLVVSDDSPATVASGSLAFRTRPGRVNRVGLNEMAKIEARKTEPIDINARVSAIRSAKASGEVFFFVAFLEVRCGDEVGGRYSTFFYEKTRQKFQENTPTLS